MYLERVKQLSNELSKQQVFSLEELKRYREAVEIYEIKNDGMTRQERRACQRMLAKDINISNMKNAYIRRYLLRSGVNSVSDLQHLRSRT